MTDSTTYEDGYVQGDPDASYQADAASAATAADAAPGAGAKRRLPPAAAVLLADAAVALVSFILLILISVQRFADDAQASANNAHAESLVLIFVVAAAFGASAAVLVRSGKKQAGTLQAVVTALVLGVAVVSIVQGPAKVGPSVTSPGDYSNDNVPVAQPTDTATS